MYLHSRNIGREELRFNQAENMYMQAGGNEEIDQERLK